MKIKLEGTREEFREKGPELIKALASRLGVDLVSLLDTKEVLEKAQQDSEQITSHYPVIRDLVRQSSQIYSEEIDTMLQEIDAVLDASEV